jgi:hypothetical protein
VPATLPFSQPPSNAGAGQGVKAAKATPRINSRCLRGRGIQFIESVGVELRPKLPVGIGLNAVKLKTKIAKRP